MTLTNAASPYVKSEFTVFSMMSRMLLALLALLIIPVVNYGLRPLMVAGASVLTALICRILFCLVRRKSISISEISVLVTGLMVPMLLPLNTPLWLPCAASAFAVLVVREPFGGFGRNPFNPAAAGVAFASLCWPKQVFSYFDPAEQAAFPLFGAGSFSTAQSPAAVLKQGFKPDILPLNMLWGNFPGPLGSTAVLVIGACGVLLFLSRSAKPETTVCFLGTAALIAAMFPRILCSPLTSVKYELLSGSLFFVSVFMVTDPVTAPRTFSGRCLYGAFAGAAAMAFRWFGAYEQGACFALLIANAAAPLMDSAVFWFRGWEGKPS
ncbi:RnfABCDGE type electron transport complex subunit D [Caproicibacter fermentans]|uniref:RnfABCDGE type electron transport complex subunit D n=1 Tax=Caproicibacter fermentans TaxID=2576756 RepID=A0A7G8T7F6_9FIRM|nr:RnfABCDGE type electron transport complex subunit D [Caproicibacter fermentans]QNK39547.1 RnfABCDGE type electron transport complex subunit D [Caproicibacter fermentans]